jgi:hypothetical protein
MEQKCSNIPPSAFQMQYGNKSEQYKLIFKKSLKGVIKIRKLKNDRQRNNHLNVIQDTIYVVYSKIQNNK